MSIDDNKSLNVKICVNCKDIWIHRVGMNYCGSCGTGTFERTHDSNFKQAENYPAIDEVFESVRNVEFPIGCSGWWIETHTISYLQKTASRLGWKPLLEIVTDMRDIRLRSGE